MAVNPDAVTALPICGYSPSLLTLSNGFQMCSGTPGGGAGLNVKKGDTTTIPNSEPQVAKDYVALYNVGTTDPCISQGVPNGQTDGQWNTVPFVTAQGCCSTEVNWETAGRVMKGNNSTRQTRLTPFTTASALGAKDADNLKLGLPKEIGALQKVWGFSGPKWKDGAFAGGDWVHGGVHADNTGVWASDEGFTIKYGKDTWKQNYLLWCRQTGDNYQASLDPYGVLCPAPDGLAQNKNKTAPGQEKACKSCSVSNFAVLGGGNEDDGTCIDPFTQFCDLTSPLTTAYMEQTGYNVTLNPNTKKPNGYTNPKGRVGGVFATENMYGPGKFTVLANLPPTIPESTTSPLLQKGFPAVDPKTGNYPAPEGKPGGRGYVFAMWTFSYTEAYGVADPTATDSPTTMAYASTCAAGSGPDECGQPSGTFSVESTAGGLIANSKKTFSDIPGAVLGTSSNGFFTTPNHEIDIEIPANSSGFQGDDMMDKLGWDTANFNTWMNDNNTYDVGALTLYQQAQAQAPKGKFFCAVGPEDDQDTYHEYSFVWYVDPSTVASAEVGKDYVDNSYVAFYLDGVEVYKCKRFVPRRSGRVLIGLWPAWWGSNYNPMDFNQAYCKIARMEFVPQGDYSEKPFVGGALVTNGAQMYDQIIPSTGQEILCDLAAWKPQLTVLHSAKNGKGKGGKSSGLEWYYILLIVIGAVVVVAGAIWGGVYAYKKKAAMTTQPLQ